MSAMLQKHVQGQPVCTGIQEYARRIDRIKLIAFLREHGMTEQRITRLRIHFVSRLFFFGLFPLKSTGECTRWPWQHLTITLCTYDNPGCLSDYTRASQREILREMNDTLMHELKHALDQQNWQVICVSFLTTLCFTLFLPLLILFFLLTVLHLPGILPTLVCIGATLIGPRVAYHFDLMERRANAFEKQYGGTYLLFHTKNL